MLGTKRTFTIDYTLVKVLLKDTPKPNYRNTLWERSGYVQLPTQIAVVLSVVGTQLTRSPASTWFCLV